MVIYIRRLRVIVYWWCSYMQNLVFVMKLRIFYFFISFIVVIAAQRINCPIEDIHFEKVLGLRPSNSNLLLYNGKKDGKVAVTEECIQRCNSNEDCRSFVIFFNISSCYWYKNEVQGVQEFDNELDFSTAWFVKTCLQVSNCSKSWVFERIPGAILVGNSTKVLPKTYTRRECQQHCLQEKDFDCRSTKFKIKDSKYGPKEEVRGVCILSNSDRHLVPSSFRASSFDDEYFENQCSSNENEIQGEFCSYEQYDNVTLSHVDAIFQNETKDTCEEICENYENFTCRGYSLVHNKNRDDCYLHSEDSKVYGPKLLIENYSATYFEKTPCLNITLTCTETYMTAKYTPSVAFLGRMYMEGYSEQPQCFSKGSGYSASVLKLSLLSKQCGIIKALAPQNRTLLTGTMILQFNPLVQTQGDRIIKVGCIFGNDSKVLAGTGITITTAPNHASPLLNTTGSVNAPNVEMRIVDLYSQQEVSSTQIGQELQLIIELKPSDDLDMWAGHLIAMTEDSNESIILLDDTGCPTNVNIFPALSRIRTNDSVVLLATFQAFKFSSSPVVRFSVIVQFCPGSCPPLNCPNYERTNVRTKREKLERSIETIDGTQIITVNRSEFDREKPPRMPLEFIMLVRNPGANSDRLVVSDGKILVAGYDYITNEVCLDYSLFIGLIITWVLIQVIFVVCCLVLVRRYKKYYEEETTTQSLEQLNKNFGIGFSNLDNRRVRWADNGDYT